MNTETKQHFHTEHLDWLNEITYWHNELIYYDRVLLRLLEATQNPSDVESIEQFKSRFDEMQTAFSNLRANIDAYEDAINGTNEPSDENDFNNGHDIMRRKIKDFRTEFQELKNDFFIFSDKNKYW